MTTDLSCLPAVKEDGEMSATNLVLLGPDAPEIEKYERMQKAGLPQVFFMKLLTWFSICWRLRTGANVNLF